MSELTLQLTAFLKLVAIIIFALLYGLGGMIRKYIRRILGSLWITFSIFIITKIENTFSLWYFLYPLFLCASLHIGYGGDDPETKLKRRFIYGLALGVSALPLAFFTGKWILFITHISFCIGSSIIFGVLNPFKNARDEETVLGTISVFLPMFMI